LQIPRQRRRPYFGKPFKSDRDEETFDWFKPYADFRHLFTRYVPDKTSRILILGCGNSSMLSHPCQTPWCIFLPSTSRRSLAAHHPYHPAEDGAFISCLLWLSAALSEDLYDDGYRQVVSIDYSPVVIERMRSRSQDSRPELEWTVADIRSLPFESTLYDVAIDKGTVRYLSNPPRQARLLSTVTD
jgi:SAM-dependent methyltransferase